MVWARGADIITSKPKVSTAGDAYDLAKAFADDFSKLVVTAASAAAEYDVGTMRTAVAAKRSFRLTPICARVRMPLLGARPT